VTLQWYSIDLNVLWNIPSNGQYRRL